MRPERSMKKIKWGIIGWAGSASITATRWRACRTPRSTRSAPGTRIRLKELGKKFGAKQLYTDYNEMLADPELDVGQRDHDVGPAHRADPGRHQGRASTSSSRSRWPRPWRTARRSSTRRRRPTSTSWSATSSASTRATGPRKREIAAGKIGKIVSMYARRNVPVSVGAAVLPKIGPIIGDGVHDTDIMLWYTGAKIETAYAQTLNVHGHKYPDLGWTTYRFDSGAIGVLRERLVHARPQGLLPRRADGDHRHRGRHLPPGDLPEPASGRHEGLVHARPDLLARDPARRPRRRAGRGAELLPELRPRRATKPTVITPEESMAAVRRLPGRRAFRVRQAGPCRSRTSTIRHEGAVREGQQPPVRARRHANHNAQEMQHELHLQSGEVHRLPRRGRVRARAGDQAGGDHQAPQPGLQDPRHRRPGRVLCGLRHRHRHRASSTRWTRAGSSWASSRSARCRSTRSPPA